MNLIRQFILLPCAVLALSACETIAPPEKPAAPADIVSFYNCGDVPLSTQYGADGAMRLNIGGRIYPVMPVSSASGTKYENLTSRPKIMFWNKGDEATLTLDDKTYPTCKTSSTAEREDIKNYRAIGSIPAWYMTVDNGKMLFNSQYGEKIVNADLPTPVLTTNGLVYKIKTGNRDMTIVIKHKSCRDPLSAQYYPDTVNVLFYGTAMKGCGNAIGKDAAETTQAAAPETQCAAPAAKPLSAFVGKNWVAKAVDGKAVTGTNRPTIMFDEGGLFTGDNGCNRYSGTYTIKDTTLMIGPKMVQTRKACTGNMAKQEKIFTSILLTSKLVDVRDGTLIISTPTRKTITFTQEKKSEATPASQQGTMDDVSQRAFIAAQ